MKNCRFKIALMAIVGLMVVCPLFGVVQQIALEAGWNLISFQVGADGITPEEFNRKIEPQGVVTAIWGYQADSQSWCTYQSGRPFISDLSVLEPGRGYWVCVTDVCVLTLEGEPWEGSLQLQPGWNLVGFSGLGEVSIASVFQDHLSDIQQIWEYGGGSMGQFVGYDVTAVPKRKDLVTISPGKGYWVKALYGLVLVGEAEILLPGDMDVPPLQTETEYSGSEPLYAGLKVRVCGEEDRIADLNGNGIIDDAWTQDTISFAIGVDRQPIVIGNKSKAGSLNWSVSEDCGWLMVEGQARGTLAAGKAYTYLMVDRSNLPAGVYTNSSVVVKAGDQERHVEVILHVATVSGDFKGYASATKINGKNIALGKVDMGLNVFMNSDDVNETKFKVIVDKDTSLLFPRDVFMDGVFYLGNCFSMTTSFTMPAGDRNAPPYDTFLHVPPELDQEGVGDKDWNTNGVLDVENPFPFPVRRSITLFGQRTNENTLEGSYLEKISGALPNDEKIFVEGSFSLSRQSYKPSQRSIYNVRDEEVEIIGQSRETVLERVITVEDAVQVRSVKVTLNMDYPKPEALTITLTSPNNKTIALHNHGSSVAAVTETNDFDGEIGKGNWTLRIVWDANAYERGRLYSWNLSVGGIATYSVTGRLVDENGEPVANAHVALSGLYVLGGTNTDENGYFTLGGLTENDYGVAVTIPGYRDTSVYFTMGKDNVDVGNVQVSSYGNLGLTGIMVSPSIGVAPLEMQFVVGHQLADGEEASSVDWTFEEINAYGETNVVHASSPTGNGRTSWTVSHLFREEVYAYRVIAEISKSIEGGEVVRYEYGPVGIAHNGLSSSSVRGTVLTSYLSDCGFVGAGTWPILGFEATESMREYAQMKRDSAAFDIDRAPFAPDQFNDSKEDTDFFVQPGTPFGLVNRQDEPLDNYYDIYSQPVSGDDRFRIITTMGGGVFGEQPSRAGNFVIQAGRIEK